MKVFSKHFETNISLDLDLFRQLCITNLHQWIFSRGESDNIKGGHISMKIEGESVNNRK